MKLTTASISSTRQTARRTLSAFYTEQTVLIPGRHVASQHPKHQGAPVSAQQKMESSNKFHWKGSWITTHGALQQQGTLISENGLTSVTPMVSNQRPFCPEGSSTEFTFIVLSAAVSDHVSFEDAGLQKEFNFKRCSKRLRILHFNCKEQQCSF